MLHCVPARTVCRLGSLWTIVFGMAMSNVSSKADRTDSLPLLGSTSQSMLPRASCRSRIVGRTLGFDEGSRNRDRAILAFSAVLPLSLVISHRDMVPLMISSAPS